MRSSVISLLVCSAGFAHTFVLPEPRQAAGEDTVTSDASIKASTWVEMSSFEKWTQGEVAEASLEDSATSVIILFPTLKVCAT